MLAIGRMHAERALLGLYDAGGEVSAVGACARALRAFRRAGRGEDKIFPLRSDKWWKVPVG